MQNFVYNVPTKVYFGSKEHLKIGKIINEFKYRRVLLHYGKNSIFKTGLYDEVIKALKDENITYYELGGVEPNPKLSLVNQGIKLVRENNIDFILAVGGGSVIDSAKLISIGAKTFCDPWKISIGEVIPTERVDVGVILTISASGSAMSNSCVITNDILHLKRGFNNELNRPVFAILNPELTYSVSRYQTSCGIVDIMMHTLERFLTNDSFSITDSIALALLKNTMQNGLKCLQNPNDYEARANVMWCESLSHNGLTGSGNKYVFMLHQLEHELSGKYDNIAHAAGLSALFTGYLTYIKKIASNQIKTLGKYLFELDDRTDDTIVEHTIEKFTAFFTKLEMPINLEELGVKEEDFKDMALKLTNNKTKVVKGIIELNYQSIIEIYELSYQ